MALVNRHILLEYDVPGPRLWHERLVLSHVAGEVYIIATPDRDVYAEELGVLSPDVRTLKVKPAAGILPPDVVAGEVYALPAWTANDLHNLREEGRRVAEEERRATAGGAGPLAAAAAAAAPVVAGAAASTKIDPVDGYEAGTLKWLAAESNSSHQYGQEVQGVPNPLVKDSKIAHIGAHGVSIFLQCADGHDYFNFLQRPARCDPRVLPVELNPIGHPERTLKEVASMGAESKVRWELAGPRTSKWCVNYLAIENLGFEGHHERLRQVTKADASSWGIQEHFQVSMALRQALLVDQLDPYNLLSIEIQFRRLQTIEYSYSEKAKDLEAKAVGGRLSLEEQTTFGGITRQYSTLMICPQLLDHVKIETEKEANLAKNLRKAREEREAARKGAKKGSDKSEHP